MKRTPALVAMLVLLLLPTAALAQATGRVVGTVTDAQTAQPLSGVNVVVVGTQRGTLSGANGQFVILNAPAGTHTVRASQIGYAAREISVTVEAGAAASVAFQLEPQAVQLQEVVAVGYGTMRRSDVTGSVASVRQEELTRVPTHNVAEALQGRVPGMDVTRSSGSPNSGVNLNVRGNRSLTASNNPLVIIDGVQFGSLADLNANDIESVEILKDASSTAIYGSRGANGVILVTTKQGGTNRTQVTVNSYVGQTTMASNPAINTGPEYIQLKREANRTTGLWNGPEDDAKIFTPIEMQNITNGVWTDFPSLLFRTGYMQSHQAGIATGSENTRAYLSLGTVGEQGILRLDERQQHTLRFNLDHTFTDRWKVGTNTQLTYTDSDQRDNPMNMANKIAPLTTTHDADGNLVIFPNGGAFINPLVDQEANAFVNNTISTRVIPAIFAEWTPVAGLSLRSNLGGDLTGRRNGIYRAANTIQRNGAVSEASYLAFNSRNLSFENILNYRTQLGRHSLNVTGVAGYLYNQNDFSSATGRNQLLSPQLFYGLSNAKEGVAIESGYQESTLLSGAGRINYGWDSRYLLTLTGRYDGSSRLSPGNQWAFFPSVALAWRISEESFLRGNPVISDLKLRGSYGISGNDAVSPYSTQASLVNIPFSFGEAAAPGYAFSQRVGNENLKWEMSATTNAGLDLALWNGRVSATLDAYRTETSDLLLERFLPATSGVTSVMQNIGRTRNQGLELSLTSNNIQTDRLSWQTSLTFSTNKEEIVDLVGGSNDIANGWFIGYPTQVFYDFQKVGIWQLHEAEEAARFGQTPGEIKVRDQNGDGILSATDDRIIVGSPRPRWSGGINNTLSFGDFDFGAFVFARIGQMMNYEYYSNYKPDGIENGSRVDYWTPENPTNAFPRPNARFSNNNYRYFTTLRYADGSFVKLRDATVGYTLPASVAGRISLNRARIYVTGKNLASWARVDNYDPERGGAQSFPMTRMFVTGIDVGF